MANDFYEFLCARWRPASFNGEIAIGERKIIRVAKRGFHSEEIARANAEQILATEPPVVIGGRSYLPLLLP